MTFEVRLTLGISPDLHAALRDGLREMALLRGVISAAGWNALAARERNTGPGASPEGARPVEAADGNVRDDRGSGAARESVPAATVPHPAGEGSGSPESDVAEPARTPAPADPPRPRAARRSIRRPARAPAPADPPRPHAAAVAASPASSRVASATEIPPAEAGVSSLILAPAQTSAPAAFSAPPKRWTPERDAVVKREYPIGTPAPVIARLLNAMDGPPVTSQQVHVRASIVGVRRPRADADVTAPIEVDLQQLRHWASARGIEVYGPHDLAAVNARARAIGHRPFRLKPAVHAGARVAA